MPYYHKKCGGEVAFWALKCKKCNHKWPWTTFFSIQPLLDKKAGPAKDMTPFMVSLPKNKLLEKGKTSYASWADNVPGVGFVASRLPNWPKWARITVGVCIVFIIAVLIIWGIT